MKALALLGLSSATYYREQAAPAPVKAVIPQKERVQPATLNPEEIAMITGWLSAPENMLLSVAKVYYKYLCARMVI